MSVAEAGQNAWSAVQSGQSVQQAAGEAATQAAGNAAEQATDGFSIDPRDFLSAREQGASAGTRIEQRTASMGEIGEIVNRSVAERSATGEWVNVICPVVIPRRGTFSTVVLPILALIGIGIVGSLITNPLGLAIALFGPHFWVLVVIVAALLWARRSVVRVPDGCQAMITKFSKLDRIVGPGRTTLLDPRKQVSYVLNTTREYPYNAPISEAPTHGGVKASVDLFLQFRIEDPAQFMFALGAVSGFSDKLSNAVSEVTRSLIYQQRAADIYDLVGESTADLLDSLNEQFLPAVRLTSANITHAEPSSQEYRADLAAPEMIRVAKEAYTYEYDLGLRKQQNEGDLNKELASLNENLSAIQAEIANHQARMDTALERETNRAKAQARQRYVEAESTANANAALLEAQALDIQAVSAAQAPEILEYRFQQDVLAKLEGLAEHLPVLVALGGDGTDGGSADGAGIDFLATATRLLGAGDGGAGLSEQDLAAIRDRAEAIQARIAGREAEIAELLDTAGQQAEEPEAADAETEAEGAPGEDTDTVEQIRASVTDDTITEQVEQLSEAGEQ